MGIRQESSASTAPTAAPGATPGPPILLADGLWQVAGPGITHAWDAAAYLVRTDTAAALVDCGSGLASAALDGALAACGVPVQSLHAVVATHGHFDHVGDGARLLGLGVPVLVHGGDAGAVRAGDPVLTCAESLYGSTFSGFEPMPVDDGWTIDLGAARLEIVHTPGHTPGSVCVVVRTKALRVLLAGDALWGGFSTTIGSDAAAWDASLGRMAALELDALSFGHGIDRLLGDPAGRLAEAQARFGSYFDPWFRPPKWQFRY